jgi:hypothetical protein
VTWLAIRSLRNRWSRALTAIVGASIAISIAFVLQGVTRGFQAETDRTLAELGNHFLVPEGVTSLISGRIDQAAAPEGTRPMIFARDSLPAQDVDVNIWGVEPGAVDVAQGRMFSEPFEMVIDVSAGLEIGDVVTFGGREIEVVGLLDGVRVYAGGPVAFLANADVQALYYNSGPLASAFASDEFVEPPEGLQSLSAADAKVDLDRSVKGAISTIVLTRTLLWIMVAGVVFILNRLNLLDRKPELATLKCLGVSGWAIGASLVFETILVGVLGGVAGCAAGLAISPLFPLAIETSWETVGQIVGLAAAVSLLSAIIGTIQLRRVAPSDAFRGET